MVNLAPGERWDAGCPPPARPWWQHPLFTGGDFDTDELLDDATALYEALVALRAESQWEQRINQTRFKTRAEVAADEILDKVVRG